MSDDLEVLDPAPVEVVYRGERLEIRPLTLGAMREFSGLVKPLMAEFVGDRNPSWLVSDDAMLIEVLETHGEALFRAAAIATGRPVEFISGGESITDMVTLATAIVRVNRDFFWRAMVSLVPKVPLPEQAANQASGGGVTSSSSSSPTGIH
ncbi:hypothetical protein QFW80_16765 [Luteimonas sp. M1R5S18]|uniref:Tail assembly chaperone n=1 Tax=Luteimonas rhizosphaericola TaxID=3042024 RepID=A0ABT6JNE4_9GAMM|nr:hypothetical protein [Luteimonas rhizosphaericola]MDH5832172.1 hypothetical protein [Luteimonas rhizosphaericola]